MFQAIAGGSLPPPPLTALVGAELGFVGDGEVVFECTPDESIYNPLGIVRGGLLCTMLDFATGAAVQTLITGGAGCPSIEIKVSHLKAVRADSGAIELRGRALRVATHIAFGEAQARDAVGEVVAQGTSSLAVVRLGSSNPE